MKKRSMILALASMLGISAAATAVSGFAWFTTQTTATISEHAYSVGAAQGDLVIGAVAANDINCTSEKDGSKNEIIVTPTSGKAFADVSSVDGRNFYKLYNMDTTASKEKAEILKEVDGTENANDKIWMSKVNANQMVCVTWSMTVANGGDNTTKMDVYLSHDGDLFTGTGTATNNYADAYRLAIFDGNNLVYFYSKYATGFTADDYNNGTFTYDNTHQWDGHGFEDTDHKHATTATEIVSSSSTGASSTDTSLDASSQLLVNDLVGGTTAHTLKFVVWCEGTNTPEEAVKTSNEVKLSLGLIGLNA